MANPAYLCHLQIPASQLCPRSRPILGQALTGRLLARFTTLLRQEVSPGHDSGIQSDMETAPVKTSSARSRRYQEKTASEARLGSGAQTGTPSKDAHGRERVRRTGHHAADKNELPKSENRVEAVASSSADAGSIDPNSHSAAPNAPIANSPVTEPAEAGFDTAAQYTQSRLEYRSRPSTSRMLSNRVGKCKERGQVLTEETLELWRKNNPHYESKLSRLMMEEARTRRATAGDSAVFYPTTTSDSPVEASTLDAPEAEPDDNDSLRPSVSSLPSFLSRRSLSKASQDDATCTSACKGAADESSEISRTSSRLERAAQKTYQKGRVVAAKVHDYVEPVEASDKRERLTAWWAREMKKVKAGIKAQTAPDCVQNGPEDASRSTTTGLAGSNSIPADSDGLHESGDEHATSSRSESEDLGSRMSGTWMGNESDENPCDKSLT